ncbi:MAG TPA: rod shape-determining protein MreC [Bryobacteraceae bacterium]
MEGFLNRYRNITVLLLVIFAQLLLLALQVKNEQDVRMIRVWTVSAVTPVARILEGLRGGGVGFIRNYITLHDTNAQNRRLLEENGRLKLENTFLKNEVNRADRAKALELFQSHTASKTLAASIIMMGAGSNSKVVYVDRGSSSGVMRGMAVVTPDGIVGKVIAAYPMSSEVLLINDPDFAAGVLSQNGQVRGTLKGEGTPMCKVDYVPLEEKIAPGEWFYTSGDDRVFPQGFPVGIVKVVRPGLQFQEILVEPSGIQRGLEDVLILIQGVHQEIPDTPPANQPIYLAPPPPASSAPPTTGETGAPPVTGTEADKLRTAYKALGEAQGHTYGAGEVGSKPPDFTKLPSTSGTQPAGRGPATAAPVQPQRPATVPDPNNRPSGQPETRGADAPGTDPSAAPAVKRPPETGPASPSKSPGQPAKSTEPPKKQPVPPGPEPSDAARRANQAAGAPKGPSH